MDFLPTKLTILLLIAPLTSHFVNAEQNVNTTKFLDRACFDIEWKRNKPYDYYKPETRESTATFRGGLLYLVEKYHFGEDVRNLVKGNNRDLLFVLSSIPNHPAALDAYSRYEHQLNHLESFRNKQVEKNLTYSAECFFTRANEVFPNNAETLLVWGIHQFRNKRFGAAQQLLKRAVTIAPDYIEAHYNLGLVYVELKDAANARKHATIAYDAGYPLQGLKNRLAELNK